MEKWYAFYTWAYGKDAKCDEFETEEQLLAFIKKAKEPDSGYWDLRVVYGVIVEFEPATYIESYRIKE